jgi:Carboxypeptidase regulatory-like domain
MRSLRNSAAPWLLLAGAAVGLAQTQPPPPADEKPAGLEGEVRNSVTGMPVERAHVSLRSYNNGGFDNYGALTNAEGKFTITGIPAASYQVRLDRVGYVAPLEVTRNALTLRAGENKDNFKLKIVPVGAISGRVLDPDGQPVDALTVQAEQGGHPLRTGVTDDRGQFRIGGLSPGKYRVRAVPQGLPIPPEIRTDGTTEVHYGATYHPGAISEKGGTLVMVGPASDVTGIDIRMVRAPILRVAGKVSGMPEGAKNVFVQVTQVTQGGGGMGSSGAQVKPDGSFEIWRPNPGKYSIRAMLNSAGEQTASGAVEVEVGDSDIDNIELRLLAAEEIRGQLVFDDEMARQAPQMRGRPGAQGGAQGGSQGAAQGTAQGPPQRPSRRIMLSEMGGMGQMKTADVSEDGAFTIPKVMAGKYTVRMMGYQAYVKSVRVGETASEGAVLNLNQGSGGAAVTVTLSSAYGEIGGTVQDEKGAVAGARVVLRDTSGLGITMNAASGADGTYRIKSVAPGTYKLLGVDESETQTMMGEPGSDDYDERAETVEVRPKETLARDLKVRPVK